MDRAITEKQSLPDYSQMAELVSAMNVITTVIKARYNPVTSITIEGTKVTVTLGDGTVETLTTQDTTYVNATQSAAGLMSAADKAKLDGVAAGANKTTVDSALSSSSTNPVQNKVVNTAIAAKANKTDFDTVKTEVNARPKTRKLATKTLTAGETTLTWTDSSITDDSLIDVYASIVGIGPNLIEQSGTTVTVTFDAQTEDVNVALVVM